MGSMVRKQCNKSSYGSSGQLASSAIRRPCFLDERSNAQSVNIEPDSAIALWKRPGIIDKFRPTSHWQWNTWKPTSSLRAEKKEAHTGSSSTFSNNGYSIFISSKVLDEFLNPAQSFDLISHAGISGNFLRVQWQISYQEEENINSLSKLFWRIITFDGFLPRAPKRYWMTTMTTSWAMKVFGS